MTFKKAKLKLKKIAKGKYYKLGYDFSEHQFKDHDNAIEVKCSVYIHGQSIHSGRTWEIAFSKLKSAMFPKPAKALNPKQAPE